MHLLFVMFLAVAPSTRLADLQRSLNDAIVDDAPIVLTEGDDFEAPAGTVIFLSAERGAARLVALARSDADEVAVLFLPHRSAWITTSRVRSEDRVGIEERFGVAAIISEPAVWFGHTHRTLTDDPLAGSMTFQRRVLMYATPSELDFGEFCTWARRAPKASIRAFVAGELGIMEYWTDARPCIPETLPLQIAVMAERNLQSEARLFKTKAAEGTPETLSDIACAHRGVFRYRFTPAP